MKPAPMDRTNHSFPHIPMDADTVYQPLYDSRTFQEVPQRATFFEVPQGMPDGELGVKTQEDTAMYVPSQMVQGNDFYMTGVGVYFVPNYKGEAGTSRAMDIADVLGVLGGGAFMFQIKNRRYLEIAPLAALQPSFPMYWAREDERLERMFKADISASGDGVPQKKPDGFALVPLYIPSGVYFRAEITFKNRRKLNSAGKLGVILYGYLIRHAM